ncbi:MAG: pseudaminic acid biosynthesis-associated methylase [Verrucomicrobiota bacterium]
MAYQTAQEAFWTGTFGDEYTDRNAGPHYEASLLSNFSEILKHTGPIDTAIEFGANRGLNLITLKRLLPKISLDAIEINQSAVDHLKSIPDTTVHHQSILDFTPTETFELSLIRGVLIHINPNKLNDVYDRLYTTSKKWILVSEYYNPTPVSVSYRGHEDRLFKRDFAGEILDRFPDLELVSYGFNYRRDPIFPQDDTTWFLLRKKT